MINDKVLIFFVRKSSLRPTIIQGYLFNPQFATEYFVYKQFSFRQNDFIALDACNAIQYTSFVVQNYRNGFLRP